MTVRFILGAKVMVMMNLMIGIVHQERGKDETLSVSCDKPRKHPGDNA